MSNEKDGAEARLFQLICKVESESPLSANRGLSNSFIIKLQAVKLFQSEITNRSLRLFKAYQNIRNDPNEINSLMPRVWIETIAYFEAYLNSVYSFLQIIAKITPYFFDPLKKVPDDYFATQNEYIKSKQLDQTYSEFIRENMDWYGDVACNRHAISHNPSPLIQFGRGQMQFVHMPGKKINYKQEKPPTKLLIPYMLENMISLNKYMNFYADHFEKSRIYVNKETENKEVQELIKDKE